jgi:predicted nucleotidyltransferase
LTGGASRKGAQPCLVISLPGSPVKRNKASKRGIEGDLVRGFSFVIARRPQADEAISAGYQNMFHQKPTIKNIDIPGDKITDFCRRNHIRTLSLFGSVLRNDFRPDSDVDVLVEFDPEHIPGFFRLHDIEEELSKILGRSTDLRTPQDLSRYFRDEVIENSMVLYD